MSDIEEQTLEEYKQEEETNEEPEETNEEPEEGEIVETQPPVQEEKSPSQEQPQEEQEEEKQCSICYTDLNLNNIVNTQCSHKYCWECFFKWIKINPTCPLCRENYI